MFGLFSKKNKKDLIELTSVGNGKCIALSEVSDPIFAKGMMGQGYGFVSKDGVIYAPIDGTVSMVADTKHGLGITSNDGVELLIHMGIDTVELKGEPFEIEVQPNEQVTQGQKIAQMDLRKIEDAGKETTVMVVITNSADKVADLQVEEKNLTSSDVAARITAK